MLEGERNDETVALARVPEAAVRVLEVGIPAPLVDCINSEGSRIGARHLVRGGPRSFHAVPRWWWASLAWNAWNFLQIWGSFGGWGFTVPSLGGGILFPPLATSGGIGCSTAPVHGGGGIGRGVGTGGEGWMMVAPNVGGGGRLSPSETRPAREGAVSTLGTRNGPRPRSSMIVFGMLAWECHALSMPWRTG